RFTMLDLQAFDPEGLRLSAPFTGSTLDLQVTVKADAEVQNANLAVTIYDFKGNRLVDVNSSLKGKFISLSPGETMSVRFTVSDLRLKPGRYTVELWLGRSGVEEIDRVPNAANFEILHPIEDVKHTETFPGVY